MIAKRYQKTSPILTYEKSQHQTWRGAVATSSGR